MTFHEQMTEAGFAYEHVPASFEDVGDGESGPCLYGHDEYNIYEDADVRFFTDRNGRILEITVIDHEFEAHLEAYASMFD